MDLVQLACLGNGWPNRRGMAAASHGWWGRDPEHHGDHGEIHWPRDGHWNGVARSTNIIRVPVSTNAMWLFPHLRMSTQLGTCPFVHPTHIVYGRVV